MARKRGSRFRKGRDDQEQLEEVEEAQQQARERKTKKVIDSIEKSRQRLRNRFREIKRLKDAEEEFGA
jgi:hypothetical protein